MTKRAQLADGTILEFPDETPDHVMDATVQGHIKSGGLAVHVTDDGNTNADPGSIAPGPEQYIYNPDHSKFMTDQALADRPTSFMQGVQEGFDKPFNNAARLLETGLEHIPGYAAVNQFAADNLGMDQNVHETEQRRQAEYDTSPTQGSGLGRAAGEFVGTAPLAMLPGGVMAQGAMAGAALTDQRSIGGVARDATIGAAGGKVGERVMRGGAQLLGPIAGRLSPELQTLINEGVRFTPGQGARGMEGGGKAAQFVRDRVANAEDKNVSLPFVGEMIRGDRSRAADDFARATLNRTLKPIGQELPAGMTGRRAVRYAGDTLSAEYDKVLPRIGQFTPDKQFADDLVAIQDTAKEMLPARAEQLNNILASMTRLFGNNGTTLDGAGLKAIETRLSQKSRNLSRSTDADQRDLADALNQARDAVRDMAGRAYPDVAADLTNINQGWAGLTQVERASLNSKGNITPNGYSQAVRMGESSTRRRGYARGTALNQDLADAGSQILPSEVADSGTAGRWAEANWLGLAAGAAKTVPYALSKGINNVTNRTPSPQAAYLADLLRRGVPAGAIGGGGSAVSLLSPILNSPN